MHRDAQQGGAAQRDTTVELRVLGAGDEATLEAFLVEHRDTSMFLRSNARQAGLVYTAQRLQASYVGAFRAGRLVAVAAHAWNGLILLQAPEHASLVVRACVKHSRRPVVGLTGPLAHVREARRALALEAAPAALQEDEWLYVLDLADLAVPPVLLDGRVAARSPSRSERDILIAWRLGYEVECLGRMDTESTRRSCAAAIDAQLAEGVAWVAVVAERPVAYSAFNATLPDVVQVGGVYTPPVLRGRGYARAVIAHSLLLARDGGASRAVLFTSNPSAMRTYEALGFRRAGDYGLILFE
jgi:predicted GNAT family acetyltransferase